METPPKHSTAPEVVQARQLLWITFIGTSIFCGPLPHASMASVVRWLVVCAWMLLVVMLNLREMRRAGLSRSGYIAPIATALLIIFLIFAVAVTIGETRNWFSFEPRSFAVPLHRTE